MKKHRLYILLSGGNSVVLSDLTESDCHDIMDSYKDMLRQETMPAYFMVGNLATVKAESIAGVYWTTGQTPAEEMAAILRQSLASHDNQ